MFFSELVFFIFLPIFFVLFRVTRGNTRLLVTLVGSYIFYGWWDWRFVFLLAYLTISNYWLGLRLANSQDESLRRRYLYLSTISSLLVLGYFKYTNFFIDSFEEMLRSVGYTGGTTTLNIILPVGISFYTFHTMSYVIDLYRGNVACERSLLRFAVFVAYFPQLLAGPIVRASHFLPQLQQDQPFQWKNFIEGLSMIAWGYVLKLVVSDSVGGVVNDVFAKPDESTSMSLIIGVVFYAYQIYGDFAGYSLIAIGLAKIMDYDFGRNFDRPYFSAGFSEFWRRWHISLSTWLRDYLYIPLGGNRRGHVRTYVNLMLTMLLGGLWHGAAMTFVMWGALHGAYLCFERLIAPTIMQTWKRLRLPNLLGRLIAVPIVFVLTCIAWVFFRAGSWDEAWAVLRGIAALDDLGFAQVRNKFDVIKGLFLIGSLWLIEASSFLVDYPRLAEKYPILHGFFIVGCVLAVSLLGTFGSAAFIYFQF